MGHGWFWVTSVFGSWMARLMQLGGSAYTTDPWKGIIGFTTFTFLLPYVEQGALFAMAKGDVNTVIPGSP